MGFTDSDSATPILRSFNAFTCIIVIVYNPNTKVAALAHVYSTTNINSVSDIFGALRKSEEEQLKVYLAGCIQLSTSYCAAMWNDDLLKERGDSATWLEQLQVKIFPRNAEMSKNVMTEDGFAEFVKPCPNNIQTLEQRSFTKSCELVNLINDKKNVVIEHCDLCSKSGAAKSLAIDTRAGQCFALFSFLGGGVEVPCMSQQKQLEYENVIEDMSGNARKEIPLFLAFDRRSESNGKGNFKGYMSNDISANVTEVRVDPLGQTVSPHRE